MQTTPSAADPHPFTDRGVEITCKIDFLTCTTRESLDDIERVFDTFGITFKELPYGFNTYRRQLVGPDGLRVGFTPGRDDISVNVPGTACTALGNDALISLTQQLRARPSRLDVAFDGCPFKPMTLENSWRKGNINSSIKRSGDSRILQQNADGNTTLYMGSKTSETRLVCYDMRGPTRLELRLRKSRALAFFLELLNQGADQLPTLALGVITSTVDFVKRAGSTDTNATRAPRLRWWSRFVKDVSKIRLNARPDPAPSIERTERHVRKNAAMIVTYLEIQEARGRDQQTALAELLNHGSMGLSDRHLARIAAAASFNPSTGAHGGGLGCARPRGCAQVPP